MRHYHLNQRRNRLECGLQREYNVLVKISVGGKVVEVCIKFRMSG
jgi:hypothetical protein